MAQNHICGGRSLAGTRSAIRKGLKDDAYKDFHLRTLDRLDNMAQSFERDLICDNAFKDLKISNLVSSFRKAWSLRCKINSLIGGLIFLYSVCQYIDGNITWEQLNVIGKSCERPAPSPLRPQKTKTHLTQCQRIENLYSQMDKEFEISKLILNEVPEVHAFVNEVLKMLSRWSFKISSSKESVCLTHDKQEQLKVIEKSCQPASPPPLQEDMMCSLEDKLKTKTHLTQCQQIENLHKQTDKGFELSKLILNEAREVYVYANKVLKEYRFLTCRVTSLEQPKVIAESSVEPASPSPLRLQGFRVVLGEGLATGKEIRSTTDGDWEEPNNQRTRI